MRSIRAHHRGDGLLESIEGEFKHGKDLSNDPIPMGIPPRGTRKTKEARDLSLPPSSEQVPITLVNLPPIVDPEVLFWILADNRLHSPVHLLRQPEDLLLLALEFPRPERI